MKRAVGLITITKADAEERVISGIMSTVETDRAGDQVVSTGIKARLPAPCLWQHDAHDPIGEIVWIDPRPDGIRFRAKLAKVDSPPSLKEKLDSYWALISKKLVKGISIGFRPLEMEPIKTGWRISSWELLEASVVTVPANASCSIQTIKMLDRAALAAARSTVHVVKLTEADWEAARHPVRAAVNRVLDANPKKFHEFMARSVGVGFAATDDELARLRERLDRIERGNGQR